MNANANRIQKYLKAKGFKRVVVDSAEARVYDEGGRCYSLVEWDISHTSDNLRIKVCGLYDMADNHADVKALHGQVI